jgi:C4-dicarboxylate transporter/malic acid transport protein.
MAVSTWLTLGPIGTGSLGLLLLGSDAPRAFIGTKLFIYAKTAAAFGPIGGLVIWGFGFWWLIIALLLTIRYVKEGMPSIWAGGDLPSRWVFTLQLRLYSIGLPVLNFSGLLGLYSS